jgi:hypothetical protein
MLQHPIPVLHRALLFFGAGDPRFTQSSFNLVRSTLHKGTNRFLRAPNKTHS